MATTKFVTEKASYVELLEETDRWRTAVDLHPVYQQVNSPVSLGIFMESHVFAVWDFMTLLKTLQRRLTGMELPWLPPQDIISARLVNEIVLAEETDEVAPGNYLSHFHLYLAAMEEVGASTQEICNFISNLKKGSSAPEALALLSLSESTKSFVLHTLAAAQGRIHELAAVFILGREHIMPKIFQQIIDQLENSQDFSTNSFMLYLKRHTELDKKYHGRMGQKLLKNLCGSNSVKWHQAFLAAQKALKARKLLWDGISKSIQEFDSFQYY